MSKKPPILREIPDLPDEIVQAGLNGELVLFVGAGLSMLLNLPSWRDLARRVLDELRIGDLLDYSDVAQLEQLNPRTQLSIAKLVADDSGFKLDLTKYFKDAAEGSSIYKAINDIGCACVTTNYDELLSPRAVASREGSSTSKPVARIYSKEEFFARRLDDAGVVVHLHGSISDPSTMVVTTSDYLSHYDHENVKHFLGELFEKKTVLFLGYSLEENELLEHILRRGSAKKGEVRRRFALQGFFKSEQPLYERLSDYYKLSFGVQLLGFVRDFKNYRQQQEVIVTWATKIRIAKPALASDLAHMAKVLGADET